MKQHRSDSPSLCPLMAISGSRAMDTVIQYMGNKITFSVEIERDLVLELTTEVIRLFLNESNCRIKSYYSPISFFSFLFVCIISVGNFVTAVITSL